ncbi:hypothetical protein LCGC14_1169900 [marine sediment metagenome]|uniref:Uncharacterized protein n=1 Tax=marine sediment metagenome TaxID=412755 RepID=A0A0F9MD61_9ZZZZ
MHGAKGGRPPKEVRITVPSQVADAFNRIYESPNLLSLSYNQALLESRIDQLMVQVQEHDASGAHKEILDLIAQLGRQVKEDKEEMNIWDVRDTVAELKRVVEPVWIEWTLWNQALGFFESVRRMNDTERKYLAMYDQMIPADQVIEGLRVIINKALKYIALSDQPAFADDMRGDLPTMSR